MVWLSGTLIQESASLQVKNYQKDEQIANSVSTFSYYNQKLAKISRIRKATCQVRPVEPRPSASRLNGSINRQAPATWQSRPLQSLRGIQKSDGLADPPKSEVFMLKIV